MRSKNWLKYPIHYFTVPQVPLLRRLVPHFPHIDAHARKPVPAHPTVAVAQPVLQASLVIYSQLRYLKWSIGCVNSTFKMKILNCFCSTRDIAAFNAPFRRASLDRGGVISFPLMVPVFPSHPSTLEYRCILVQGDWWSGTLVGLT